jgi:acyl-CoA synthetase (AMP-forming)/AMP-acid ligase II/thioesterase domain-containing protein
MSKDHGLLNTGESTVWRLLESAAARFGPSPAILAPGREPMTFRALADQTERLARGLRGAGIGAADRVAVVLPNGPEMAAAFLAVAASAGCAPLNPNYTRPDFEFYLRDLRAKAVLADPSTPPPALEAAQALSIPVLTLRRLARAGEFALPGDGAGRAAGWPECDHIALLLHTSGTTSRPKLVPLSSANLAASAANIAGALALTPADRCLNIMPLFHIHGLMAAVLASVDAGASVVSTDGVYAGRFFDWMREFRPTWYTAVPTMHQAILAQAAAYEDVIREVPLRFIRSCSSALLTPVLAELERVFGAPVIEAYGMTEAAHQVASNPLPPAPRKPGSVGLAAGPRVAIMDQRGELLPPGSTGEVVIGGPTVTSGYEANDAANQAAFTRGWFRTGDQGWMDPEGYLFLTGRLKELINRGGEKISPREVDEALLAHPAVRSALAFAVPHAQLGEEVAAAVELHEGQAADPGELRRFAAGRLPAFKVPRLIRVVASIPKGSTGKPQRIGLTEKLGLEALDDTRLGAYVAPRNAREERIAAIWRELLPGARAGVEDRFEALGGDSLLAVRMLAAVGAAEGLDLPYERFVEDGTIAALAEEIESRAAGAGDPLVTLQSGDGGRPLVCLPGHDGGLLGLARVAAALGGAYSVWAIDLARLGTVDDISGLARLCLSHLRRRQPRGPYRLAGVCFGGCLALEMACQIARDGGSVEFLSLIDTLNPAWRRQNGIASVAAALLRSLRLKARYHSRVVQAAEPAQRRRYLSSRARAFFLVRRELIAARLGQDRTPLIVNRRLLLGFRPGTWPGDALLIRVPGRRLDAPDLGWRSHIQGRLDVVDVLFDPLGALAESNAVRVAAILRERLDRL